MAYTNNWSSTDPLGSVNANTIDEEIRKVRVDLEERLEDVLIEDMTDDPWVVQDAVKGKVAAKVLFIPACAFVANDPSAGAYGDTSFTIDADQNARCPLILPVGVTLNRFRIVGTRSGSFGFGVKLNRATFATTPVHTELVSDTVVSASGGFTYDSGTPLSVDILTATTYNIEIDGSGTSLQTLTIYGVELTYETPDSRYTI